MKTLKNIFFSLIMISMVLWSFGAPSLLLAYEYDDWGEEGGFYVHFVDMEMEDLDVLYLEFSLTPDQTSAETVTNYALNGTTNPESIEYLVDGDEVEIILTFSESTEITCGAGGDTLEITGVIDAATGTKEISETGWDIFCQAGEDGGWFGPQLVINEVVANPSSDWSDSAGGNGTAFDDTPGTDTPAQSEDEYIELRINQGGGDFRNWSIEVFNTDYDQTSLISSLTASGDNYDPFWSTFRYVQDEDEPGSIDDTTIGEIIVLGDFTGNLDMAAGVHIDLYDETGAWMDGISFGSFDDGWTDDNASSFGDAAGNEAVGRDKYGTDMGWPPDDFQQQSGSPGAENSWNPPLKLFGVWPFDSTHIGIDFNKPPSASTVHPSNFTLTKDPNGTPVSVTIDSVAIESAGDGRVLKLVLAEEMENYEYKLTIGDGLTDADGSTVETWDRDRYFWGFAADNDPPVFRHSSTPWDTRIELWFDEWNGLDCGSVSLSITKDGSAVDIADSGNGWWCGWDDIQIDLDQPMTSGDYLVTVNNLQDYDGNSYAGDNPLTVTGYDATTYDDGSAPWVWGTSPWDWEMVPLNRNSIEIEFSEEMDDSTFAGNIVLHQVDWDTWEADATKEVTLTQIVWDNGRNTAIATVDTNDGEWVANTDFILEIKSGVADNNSTEMGYRYWTYFTTEAADDSPPNVYGHGLEGFWDATENKYIDVPVGHNVIPIWFSKNMDYSTIVDDNTSDANSNITLTYSSQGSTQQVLGHVNYDSWSWTGDFFIDNPLDSNTTYTLTVDTNVTDTMGNDMQAEYSIIFETGGADETGPEMMWADCDGWMLRMGFGEPLKESTLITSNFTLESPVGTNIDISDYSVEWFPWDQAVEIPGGCNGLPVGQEYQITASSNVKDMAGNSVQTEYNSITGSVFDPGATWEDAAYIVEMNPWWGQPDVPANIKALTAVYSEGLKSDTVSATSVKLFKVEYNPSTWSETETAVSGTVTYNADTYTIKFTPDATLTANTQYRWKINEDNTIEDEDGKFIWSEWIDFWTTEADTSVPTVSWTWPNDNETGVATGLGRYEIGFSKSMDPSTINKSNISWSPTINGSWEYDAWGWVGVFKPSDPLTVGQEYTLTISTDVKDSANNAIAETTKSFTVTATADTAGPTVNGAFFDPWMTCVMFDEAVKEEGATALRNYSMIVTDSDKSLDSTTDPPRTVSFNDKGIWYDHWDNRVCIDGLALTAGDKARITVSNVKDLNENSINTSEDTSGTFRTIDATANNFNEWEGIVFDPTEKEQDVHIWDCWPWPGEWEVAPNLSKIKCSVSNHVDPDSVTASTFYVAPKTGWGFDDCGDPLTGVNVSYDSGAMEIVMELDPTSGTVNEDKLDINQEYCLRVTTGMTDDEGNALDAWDPWDFTSTAAWKSDFKTASAADDTDPIVEGTNLYWYEDWSTAGNPIVNVPLYHIVDVKFNKTMDANTVEDGDAADGSSALRVERKSDGQEVSGWVEFDPWDNRAMFFPESGFAKNTEYTLVVTSDVKDLMGNGVTAYNLDFTTENVDDNLGPWVDYAECENFECRIWFNERVDEQAAKNVRNYTLESPIGVEVSLTNKNVDYDDMGNGVFIRDLDLQGDQTFRITVGDKVVDMASNAPVTDTDTEATDISGDYNAPRDICEDGNCWDTQFNQYEGYVWTFFDGMFGGKEMDEWTDGEKFFDHMVDGAHIEPMIKLAGQTSNMIWIDFPTTVAIPEGGTIKIKFPDFNVDSAAMVASFDPSSPQPNQSPVNNDINGWGTGTITIDAVSINKSGKTVTLTTAGGATMSTDHISLDLQGIRNPGNGGEYTATITTTDADGKVLEGPMDSQPIFIMPKGEGTIQGTITAATDSSGVDSGQTLTIVLDSWAIGGMLERTIVFNDGKVNTATGADSATEGNYEAEFKFEGLPINSDYFLWTRDPHIQLNVDGSSQEFYEFHTEPTWLQDSTPVDKNYTLQWSDATSYTDSWGSTFDMKPVTITITDGPADETIIAELGCMSFYEKEVTLDSNGDGTATFNVPEGSWCWANVMPYMPEFAMGPMMFEQSFAMPPGRDVNVNGALDEGLEDALDAVTFDLSTASADSYIGVTVTANDAAESPLADIEVFAHDPMGFWSPPQFTNASGVAYLKVPAGNYIVGVGTDMKGFGWIPEKNVSATSSHDSQANAAAVSFKVKVPDNKVTGVVYNSDDEPLANVPVDINQVEVDAQGNISNWLPKWIGTMTDENGKYAFYADDNTSWRVVTFIPGWGESEESIIQDVTGNASGKNLYIKSDLVAVTGSVVFGSTPLSMASFYAKEPTNYFFNEAPTNANGEFTLYLPAGTYDYGFHSWEFGERKLGTLDISDGVDENLGEINLGEEQGEAIELVDVTITFDETVEQGFIELKDTNGNGNSVDINNTNQVTVKVPEGEYTVMGNTKEAGKLTNQTLDTVTSSSDQIDFDLPTMITIGGTITDDDTGLPIENAVIHIQEPDTKFTSDVETLSDGTWTAKVKANDTYKVSVDNTGYVGDKPVDVSVGTANSTGNDFDLETVDENYKITGQITLDGTTADNNAYVAATTEDGDSSVAPVDDQGNYTLYVKDGEEYTVTAVAKGYVASTENQQTLTIDGVESGIDLDLDAISGWENTDPFAATFKPSKGAVLHDDQSGTTIEIPPNAVADSDADYTASIEETTIFAASATMGPVAYTSYDVKIRDDSGNKVTNLDDKIFIEWDYTDKLDEIEDEGDLGCGYFDEKFYNWVSTPGIVDEDNNTLKCQADHLTGFAPTTVQATATEQPPREIPGDDPDPAPPTPPVITPPEDEDTPGDEDLPEDEEEPVDEDEPIAEAPEDGDEIITPVENVIPERADQPDLIAEAVAVEDFAAIQDRLPENTQDWNAVSFITYGTDYTVNTAKMSPRDRKGLLIDYKDTFGKLPDRDKDWADVHAMAKGERPEERNLDKEAGALSYFVGVNGRLPESNDDWTFVAWIAYKMRPTVRDLDLERAAIVEYQEIFNDIPDNATEWAVVRAMAYITL